MNFIKNNSISFILVCFLCRSTLLMFLALVDILVLSYVS